MAAAADSKSAVREDVRVRVPPPAPAETKSKRRETCKTKGFAAFYVYGGFTGLVDFLSESSAFLCGICVARRAARAEMDVFPAPPRNRAKPQNHSFSLRVAR